MRVIRFGTRGSALAQTQTQGVIAQLRACHPDVSVETRIITTLADRVHDLPLDRFRTRGVFVKEIENALLQDEIDVAVHSCKDLPSELPPELVVGAVPAREDPRDALVARQPEAAGAAGVPLRQGAIVGTSSGRRKAQLRHYRPDLQLVDLRGNVDTRLRRLETEGMDAIVLAAAGLARLNLSGRITCCLSPEVCLPAVCQGALAVECRATDTEVLALLAALEDPAARRRVRAERALLSTLGGGCAMPIGALARLQDGVLLLDGMIAAPDGSVLLREQRAGSPDDPEALGREVGEALLAAGGRAILDALAEERQG